MNKKSQYRGEDRTNNSLELPIHLSSFFNECVDIMGYLYQMSRIGSGSDPPFLFPNLPVKSFHMELVTKPIQFVKDVYLEFKKVRWPTRQETIRLTAYVIGVSLVVGLLVSGMDVVFKEGLTIVLGK